MALRTFVDPTGTQWQVWEVPMQSAERLRGDLTGAHERRTRQLPEQRENIARRREMERRVAVPAEYEHGWLAFASSAGSRRLAPIPPDWISLTDGELNELCEIAVPTRGSGPSLVE